MFDYRMLNDYEFEILCKDIFQREFEEKEKMYTFTSGRDGGVDICDKNQSYIIQVKHYSKSTVSNLITSLKKEVEKINKLPNLEKYYIMTSLSLTREKKNEILGIFSKFIPDISHIWCKEDIDVFLENEINSDIVRKNFKLWLNATHILGMMSENDLTIDSMTLLDNIKKNKNLYVDTKSYYDSLRILEEYNTLILLGAPGVGKSTISEMLLLFYINKGYSIRYATSNNIESIKKSLVNQNSYEIILLDDFLGQHYLKLDERQPNEVKALLAAVRKNKNKKVILNTRITIFNEAIKKSIIFQKTIDEFNSENYTIDLNKITELEKAKILYNHLYFKEVPIEYCRNLYFNKKYKKIVAHKNYNPRLIEFVTEKRVINSVKAEDYAEFILENLNHPEEVWRDEFEYRMENIDRIFMNTLYSLGDTKINKDYVIKAFNDRVKNIDNIDTTINNFETVLLRLTKSLLLQSYSETTKEVFISVLNPSINDYLQKSLRLNPIELTSIAKHSTYYEQIKNINRLENNCNLIESFLYDKYFYKFDTFQASIYYYYLEELVKFELLDETLRESVYTSLNNIKNIKSVPSIEKFSGVLMKILTDDFLECYQLKKIFDNVERFKVFITVIDFKTACNLIDRITYNSEIKKIFFDEISPTIMWELSSEYDSIIEDAWVAFLENLNSDGVPNRIVEDDLEEIQTIVLQEVYEIFDELIISYFNSINISFFENIDERRELEVTLINDLMDDIKDEVHSRIIIEIEGTYEPEYEYEPDYIDDSNDNEDSIMDEMFSRLAD